MLLPSSEIEADGLKGKLKTEALPGKAIGLAAGTDYYVAPLRRGGNARLGDAAGQHVKGNKLADRKGPVDDE
jgi:hypothetical protein